MNLVVTGGAGFIGKPLVARLLAEGHQVRVLSRNPEVTQGRLPPGARAFAWSPPHPVPEAALQGAEAVVHLAGENIGTWPWTEARKRRIRDSRVLGTRSLVESMRRASPPPRVLVAASAVGYYGDRGDLRVDESAGPGRGFLAGLVADWEWEIFRAEEWGMRAVAVRNGLVLGPGGALEKMALPFRLGLGAVPGSGRQYVSWIHREDAVGIIAFALAREEVRGAVNACAPGSRTQREFSRTLARVLRRPLLFRAPAWAMRAALGEMADTLLASQRISSDRIRERGYRFRFPDLEPALAEILGAGSGK